MSIDHEAIDRLMDRSDYDFLKQEAASVALRNYAIASGEGYTDSQALDWLVAVAQVYLAEAEALRMQHAKSLH